MKTVIIINPGHSSKTPGKCSPILNEKEKTSIKSAVIDERYREWKGNRDRAKALGDALKAEGYEVRYVPTDNKDVDLSLQEIGRQTNKIIQENKDARHLFISVHSNAAGNGGWYKAKGFCVYTTRGQNNSDKLADKIIEGARKYISGTKIRVDRKDGDDDQEANFAVIRYANCPAVLLEEFFHDNYEDIVYGTSPEGIKELTDAVVYGVNEYVKSRG